MRKIPFPILLVFLLSAGCDARPNEPVAPTSTAGIAAATPAPTLSPLPSDTALPSPAPPTSAPVEGITSTQVNVRAEPSTASQVLGIIPANTKVEISGKDISGNWWQILYPQGEAGRGWVTAQYVTAANGTAVPVIGGGTDSKSVAVVQQQINVRSGPGTGFNSLGTLNARDVVNLTGKDANSTWLQIEFSPGPDGRGWVNAAFVRAQGLESLPIITEAGQTIGTGTPTGIPATPTRTLMPAPADNDTSGNPIVSVIFTSSGTHTLIYNGDVSSPTGDKEDWIRFVPFSRRVLLEISCTEDDLNIGIAQNARILFARSQCASRQFLDVQPNQAVEIHVQAADQARQSYTSYTIKVKSIQ